MKKYKVLLAGNSKKLISNFFLHMSSTLNRTFLSFVCAQRQEKT